MIIKIFTGGGKLMYRMTNPAEIKKASRNKTIAVSHTGRRSV